jgi:hypothetical protein
MKLAAIILPLIGNNGADLFMIHQQLKHEVLTKWGGYTSYETIGGWAGRNGMVEGEKAIKYEVAMSLADVPKLRAFAAFLAYKAEQECVMIVTPNGDVEFVDPADHGVLTPSPIVA